MAKITFSKIARSDLKEIIDYIKRDSPKYAFIEKTKIVGTLNRLIRHPLIGRVFPDLEDEQYRELIFQNYRIIYKVKSKDDINILTIHRHSRLISNNPAFKKDQ